MIGSQDTIELMKKATVVDDQYQLLRHQISIGWLAATAHIPTDIREFATFADESIEADKLVFKGQRVVVPREARAVILQRIHSSHIGVNGCICRARKAVFYPGLTADIKKTVCWVRCVRSIPVVNDQRALDIARRSIPPVEKISVDIFTFHNQDYLITVCYLVDFFRWTDCRQRKPVTSYTV